MMVADRAEEHETERGANIHEAAGEEVRAAIVVAGFEGATDDVELAPCHGCQSHRPEDAVKGVRTEGREKPVPLCPDCRAVGVDDVMSDGGVIDADLVRTDGGEDNAHASRVNEQLDMADDEDELEPLHTGDQVSDADEEDGPRMVVMRRCDDPAGQHQLETCDETVAEYNDVPGDEDVYQVVFAKRTDKDLADCTRYPYPRSRLEIEERVHDVGGEE